MILRALLVLALLWPAVSPAQTRSVDPAAALVEQLEQAATAGSPDAVLALGVSPEASGLTMFAALAVPKPTRFIIKERDRAALQPAGESLLIEVFGEYGGQATITTWRLDAVPAGADGTTRRIGAIEELSTISGLYRLEINPAKQFEFRNVTVQATDMTLEIPAGSAFVAETPEGPTAIVLLGRGRMRFAPSDAAERTQVRIFSGDDALTTEFDAVFIRVRPAEFADILPPSSLQPARVDAGDLRRATEIFNEFIGQTFNLDLRDLSRERWSLIPTIGDLVAEVRTRRLGSLTYARSTKDAEDISLFERRRRKNIAVYASAQKLAMRGRFYSEDELVDYDVLRRDVDVAFSPDRMWVEGTATLDIRVRTFALATLTLRLADPLNVRSIVAGEYGRLLYLRVIGQNSVLVNLPATIPRNGTIRLTVTYGGRLEPQQIEREGLVLDQQGGSQVQEEVYIPVEPQYVYSNRSYWYPQNTVTDYAVSRLRIAVPADYDVVASGIERAPPSPIPAAAASGQRPRKQYLYEAPQPVRYLSCIISRFNRVTSREMLVKTDDSPAGATPVTLNVVANPRQVARSRSLADRAAAIFEYYGQLVGDAPFPSFTLAVTENDLPGGHSPAYFAILNQPLPLAPIVWRNDPVAFDGYQPYFLAHEVAHQWWGQGVGWKNYHEQWLSEGFAQYFAALYAERDRGDEVFRGMLRQMRRWSIEQSSQGPVYLGYRLGHIKSDGRVFRAVVYNKGAMVLHMLRRLMGDEKFFTGMRQFYTTWRFRKAGTDDFRQAMEKISGMPLEAFFDGWIYGSSIPVIGFTSAVSGNEAHVRFEHRGAVIPTPVTVTISYADGRSEEQVVAVTDRVVEHTIALRGAVRSIEANRDSASLAEFEK
jgi:hypothetical protein